MASDVIHPEDMERLARDVDKRLRAFAGERKGMAILVFGFGGQGDIQYCSNARREDVIAKLRELLEKFEMDRDPASYRAYPVSGDKPG